MDIKANECLYCYGPPRKSTFDNIDVGVTEGEPTQMVLLKEALKSRVAVYKEAMEEAAKAAAEAAAEAAANAVAEAPPGELGGPGEPVAIPCINCVLRDVARAYDQRTSTVLAPIKSYPIRTNKISVLPILAIFG